MLERGLIGVTRPLWWYFAVGCGWGQIGLTTLLNRPLQPKSYIAALNCLLTARENLTYCNGKSEVTSLLGYVSDNINLQHDVEGQACYLYRGANGWVRLEMLAVNGIHRGEVVHIAHKDGHFENVVQ